jgi:hypothetical protein
VHQRAAAAAAISAPRPYRPNAPGGAECE